ncbi:hypothetical protein JXA63_04040 [Candidatus Woesebacteria bacterium]|nr:hypothetical protein [Candidatus Woesebacteria bacterium]
MSHDIEGIGFTYVPNSNEIAYFAGVEDVYSAYTINYYDPNNKRVVKYKIPGEGKDSIGNLQVSSNKAMVCFEHGSSGFHGYSIYRLSDMLELGSGGQYSYCEHWINNSSIVVRYKPYNNPSRVTHKRIYDIDTGKFDFISVDNYMHMPE